MHLRQAREDAKKLIRPEMKITFDIVDPNERLQHCYWIDPVAGTFQMAGNSGFSSIDDFQLNDPQVQNMKMEKINGNV